MKVSEVSMVSGDREIFCFSLTKPKDNDRYYIRTMSGMDAADIVSRFNQFGLYSGQPLVTQSIIDREIVLRVVLNPEWRLSEDYSTLRDDIYRGISASRTGRVQLRLLDIGVSVAEIEGTVTKVEVPIFSSTPELQITINCPNAMFVAPNSQSVDPAAFVYTAAAPYGYVATVTDAQSTAPHGLLLDLAITNTTAEVVLMDNDPVNVSSEWEFRITHSMLSGDIVTIDTRTRNRAVYLTRGAVRTDLMTAVGLDSIWPRIFPGRNHFLLQTRQAGLSESYATINTIEHYATYWGI